MNKEIIIVAISSGVTILAGLIAWIAQHRIARFQRDADGEKAAARYREPLARAAADLQSRLFTILEKDFFGTLYANGDERERSYAINNTVFVVAQYFAWAEAIREEMQFIDLKNNRQTRALSQLQGSIYSLFQTDSYGKVFRVFAGEQRAIGERMLRNDSGRRCIGYGEFLTRAAFADDLLFGHLISDVTRLATGEAEARTRMVALQRALVDLINYLDPQYLRFAKDERQKLAA